jgi:AI-2 transport system ATP-binding protein
MNQTIAPLLEINKLYKYFSENPVLRGVSLSLENGEIHAIVGGNGAGKSTLMKIITGLYKADSGKMKISGNPVLFSHPHEAHQYGVYLVPQEPLIFPNMTVEENIMIGMPNKKSVLKEKIEEILSRLGWNLDLFRMAGTLSIAEQQLVEILRGLVREAKILILDEPTSTLTFREIKSLFQTIRQLTEDGMGVFYITHRFSEIFELAHSVSVLRDGIISAQGKVSEFTYERLLEGLMPTTTIHSATTSDNKDRKLVHTSSTQIPALVIDELTGVRFQNVSFTLHKGEILGIAGVVGAGRTELAEAIIGLTVPKQGRILLNNTCINSFSIQKRIKQGLVYVPEDRHSHGVFSIASIQSNISSTIMYHLKGLLLPFKQEKKIASHYMADLKIISTGTQQELKDLSGGNQQKVVLAKYLAAKPKVIILDEPTRGIDANARNDIYRIIHELKASGLAVILISSDMEEIEKLSDTVVIMHEGKIVKTLQENEINIDTITTWAFGAQSEVTR